MNSDDRIMVSDDVAEAARRVEMIVMDVDGVLTDGSTYQLDNGEQFVRFSVQDGTGFVLAQIAGIGLAVISGREVTSVRVRLERFPEVEIHLGCVNKEPVFKRLCKHHGLTPERTAYIGDDLNDLPLLEIAGLPVAVANAVPEVKAAALYRTRKCGGNGAVREVIDLVLMARGLYDKALREYLERH